MEKPPTFPPERNAQVHGAHRRDTRLQIYLPLVIAILLVLAGVVVIVIYGLRVEATLRRWADVSLIWVIIPALFIGLIFMIVVIGVLYAATHVVGVVPGYGRLLQGYFLQAQAKVLQLTNALVEPLLRLRSAWAAITNRKKFMNKQPREH
jgi:hypothetical protein